MAEDDDSPFRIRTSLLVMTAGGCVWPIYMAALRGDFRSWLVASVMPTYFLFLSLGRLRRRPRWLKWTRVLLVVLIAAVVVIVTLLPPGVTRNAAGERSALEQQNNDAAGR